MTNSKSNMLIYGLVVVLFFIGGVLFIAKEVNYISETKKQINNQQKKLMMAQDGNSPLNTQNNVPLEPWDLLADICTTTNMFNLKLNKFYTSGSTDSIGENIGKIYSISITGGYDNFMYWLENIEKKPYFLKIESLSSQKLNNTDENYLFLFSLRITSS